MPCTRTFKKTDKQREAIKILSKGVEAALLGGGRSGKTAIICLAIMLRALKEPDSRHLIVRLRFNHVKQSVWYDTWKKVSKMLNPDLVWKENKQDWFLEASNGAQVWFGGIDSKDRMEKILGNEYATIYINEASQVDFAAVNMLKTRLAQKTGLVNRLWYDFNPPSKKHWTYKYFIEGVNPIDGDPLKKKIPYVTMNPEDNKENISEDYEELLDTLSKRERERFKLGKFSTDVEGALWDYDMIIQCKLVENKGPRVRTVVAVDPSTTAHEDSDECGIVVASRYEDKSLSVDKDLSAVASPNKWAQIAMDSYDEYNAAAIVVETNQGGDMIETILRGKGFKGKIIKVHAKQGKYARAEPISALYEQGLVRHADGLDKLEEEYQEYVPLTSTYSPNRLDAGVYALLELSGKLKTGVNFEFI